MKNYGLFDVTFFFIRLYNITNVQNSSETSRSPQEFDVDVCSLPSHRGSCNGNIKRHYFHSSSGRCSLFMYSGCGGNQNNFITKDECQQRCGKNEVTIQGTHEYGIDVCGLAPERGRCQMNSDRYFFDRTKGQCVLFTYGGCGGNMNNFLSEELCLQHCSRKEVTTQRPPRELEIDVCGLVPPERGLCRGHLRRYFFERIKGQCVLFEYGGCGANLNFFISEEECLQRCDKSEVTIQGTPEFGIDVCGLAPEKGRCQMNSDRYFFDRPKGQCVLFTYSGCGGNMNNFLSEELCLQRCGRNEVTTQRPRELEIDVCGLVPPERGICRGHLRRYFFDRTKGQCVLFKYGGCGANLNFFISEEECLQRCGRSEVTIQGTYEFGIDVCGLAPEKGRCQMNSDRYFFDRTKGQCVLFTYSGCGGNMNNFLSEELCLQRCGRNEETTQRPHELEIDVCGLVPPERGLCRGHLRKYFFDRTKGQCVLFEYGGCGANLNFFMSEEECLQRCGRREVTIQGTHEYGIDVCGLAPEKGRCQMNSDRYFFDRTKGQCVLFTYGGCGGNMNNFLSEELCLQRCSRKEGKNMS